MLPALQIGRKWLRVRQALQHRVEIAGVPKILQTSTLQDIRKLQFNKACPNVHRQKPHEM
jgi:hypothetical protein